MSNQEQEIQKRHLQFDFQPEKIDFPAPDKAIVSGFLEVNENGELIQRNARKIELLNQNGQWYLNDVREVEIAPPPDVHSDLKVLEWLIGNWKDKDQNVIITFTAKWDKYRNFIVQRFKMDVFDLEAMEGIQIIAWDPIENAIRSWVFDSDGGFGKGLWTKQDNGWRVKMHYVMSDDEESGAVRRISIPI